MLFLFFSGLIAVGRISSIFWIKMVRGDMPCLVPNFRGILFSFLKSMLAVGFHSCFLSSWGSLCLFVFFFFGQFLLQVGVELCQMTFLLQLKWSHEFFFSLLIWYITWIDFQILNKRCTSGINPTWSWHIIIFISCWITLAKILWGIFTSIFTRDINL